MTKWCGSVVTHASPTGKTAALPSSNSTSSSQKHGRLTQRTSLRKSTSEERLAHPSETSLRQVIERVVRTITTWGREGGYFADDAEEDAFADELRYILVTQRAAFNSPVWFNIGVPGVRQQASACFILSVDDTMNSILNWYREEGVIFKGGSGSGVNLSKIRSSAELLEGGGTASGPVSFMRGADASAGTIKSGGKTRRAAKMAILNVEHPDVEEFIWCKVKEERKARDFAMPASTWTSTVPIRSRSSTKTRTTQFVFPTNSCRQSLTMPTGAS